MPSAKSSGAEVFPGAPYNHLSRKSFDAQHSTAFETISLSCVTEAIRIKHETFARVSNESFLNDKQCRLFLALPL